MGGSYCGDAIHVGSEDGVNIGGGERGNSYCEIPVEGN